MQLVVLVVQCASSSVVFGIGDCIVYVTYDNIIVVESITVHRQVRKSVTVCSHDVSNMKICDCILILTRSRFVKLKWDVRNIRELMDNLFQFQRLSSDCLSTNMIFECDAVGLGHYIATSMY